MPDMIEPRLAGVRAEALTTLAELIEGSVRRAKRSLKLLRSTDEENAWFMYLPSVFNHALDIRETERVGSSQAVWTQGANFSFAKGDMIYDTQLAYQVWATALREIRICIQVSEATAATSPGGGSPRNPGSVAFNLMAPNEHRNAVKLVRTHKVTQDEFVRLLIVGFPSEPP
jgi:hypothetical protein